MATTPMTTRERILYPVDWLEERSGLVGGLKYFLFRKVPGDVNWFQTLGSATLTAFIVQAITGVILAMYYKPSPDEAYASIQYITNDLWGGWLVRGMHRWGASVLHHPDVPAHGARLPVRRLQVPARAELADRRRPARCSASSRASPATCCRGTRRRTGRRRSGSTSTRPRRSSGPFLAQFLQGGSAINEDTLSRFYAIHMLVLPGGLFALIGLHLYLVIRLGVTSPPWSQDAAGQGSMVKESEPTAAREGLTRPAPRGENGNGDRPCLARGSRSASATSGSTRRTSRSAGRSSTPTRCSTTRSCRSSS